MGVEVSYERDTPVSSSARVDLGASLLVLEQDFHYKLNVHLCLNVFYDVPKFTRTEVGHDPQRLRNVLRFRVGLVFKAHRLCVSLNSRPESNKEEEEEDSDLVDIVGLPGVLHEPPEPLPCRLLRVVHLPTPSCLVTWLVSKLVTQSVRYLVRICLCVCVFVFVCLSVCLFVCLCVS